MTDKITVHVNGSRGRMGSLSVKAIAADPRMEVVGESGRGDDLRAILTRTKPAVVVDFTTPEVAYEAASTIVECGCRPVLGTTGLSADQIQLLTDRSAALGLGGVIAPNFALGAVLLMNFAATAARYLPHVEIIELHHDRKLDAPSGTAVKTANLIAAQRAAVPVPLAGERETYPGARGAVVDNIHIHSVRLPGFVAHEEVIFGGHQEILTIRHDSMHRECFMPGVVLACAEVMKLNTLVYGLEHLMAL